METKDIISVVVSPKLGAMLRELAKKDRRSVSSFVRIILEDKYEEKSGKENGLVLRRKAMSEETRKRRSLATKGKNNPHYGKANSEESKRRQSVAMMGDKSPNWRGGTSLYPYPIGWRNYLKESIRKRDNYFCQECYAKQNGRKLSVHHIDYNKDNLDLSNLISLCQRCHMKTNIRDRKYWQPHFEEMMKRNL